MKSITETIRRFTPSIKIGDFRYVFVKIGKASDENISSGVLFRTRAVPFETLAIGFRLSSDLSYLGHLPPKTFSLAAAKFAR